MKPKYPERRLREEVEERLRAAEGEARPLDEGAVCVELVSMRIDTGRVGADTKRDIAAHRTVFGLVAGISRDVAADTTPVVVGVAVVHIATLRHWSTSRSCSKLPQRGPNRRS